MNPNENDFDALRFLANRWHEQSEVDAAAAKNAKELGEPAKAIEAAHEMAAYVWKRAANELEARLPGVLLGGVTTVVQKRDEEEG